MKNVLLFRENGELEAQIEDIPIPEYADNEILIKVVVAGSNPKDFKLVEMTDKPLNHGDDAAGIVAAVGSKVKNFHKGDRVTGFHQMLTERGAYAEYTVCPQHTVWHIPDSMSFEEAATFPLASFTAGVALFRNLGLPTPFDRSDVNAGQEKVPLIINAASGALGAYAIKLAKLNPNISPIIGTAGKSADFAKQVGADAVVDYRAPDAAEQISKALNGKKCRHVLDAESSDKSLKYLLPNLERDGGRYTHVSPFQPGSEGERLLSESGVWHEQIWVGSVHETKLPGGQMFGAVMSRVFEWAQTEGRFPGQPYKVVDGGLAGVKDGLNQLRNRRGGNEKFVYRVADTPGLSASGSS